MSLLGLVAKSMAFYWRTNLAVLLAVAVATGVLTGALAVGDSVQYTLRRTLEARLGDTEFAVVPQGRYFRAELAADLEREAGGSVAPVLQVAGILTNEDGSRRINRVQVVGVSDSFYALGGGDDPFANASGEGIVLSESVAERLYAVAGDEVVLRVEKPSLMPRDVPLASDEDRTVASRLKVVAVAGEEAFGRFDLQANQQAPMNVFVPLHWLGEQIEQSGQANTLLATGHQQDLTANELNAAVERVWQPADAALILEHLKAQNSLELRSRRVFVDEPIADAALEIDGAAGLLTYFVNEIRLGEKATPYSTVAAVGPDAGAAALLPVGMADEEIVINEWLAEDLGARVGDSLEIKYYKLGPKRKLREEQSTFKVVRIVPLEGPAHDPNLMPDFPGLADAENCRDWEPGVPVDLDRIRPKDETYWDDYRGTPKAFITLESGQARWRNRYGDLTAVRYPWREGIEQEVRERLTEQIDPATVGLFFQPVRDRGLRAGREGTDFGRLFLYLSMFLIGGAVILTGLLFVFGVEGRRDQIGMLMAVGWPAIRVKRLLLAEGGVVALFGSILGVGAGLLYTRLMVYGLSTLWSGAVADADIHFDAGNMTLLSGGLGGLVVAVFAIWVTLRRQTAKPARQLLAGSGEESLSGRTSRSRGWFGLAVAVVGFVGVAAFLWAMGGRDSQAMAGAFFGAGALLLIGTLGLSQAILRIAGGGWDKALVSLRGLGLRNATRRSSRSLAIVGLLACGVFMVVSVQVFRLSPLEDPQRRDSGTGGFAIYAESAIGILHDLDTPDGREELGLEDEELRGLGVVQFRVHEGDDASCQNLNRAQRPRLLGVASRGLKERDAFAFTSVAPEAGGDSGWDVLRMDLENGVVPAVGDQPTLKWGLGKNIGEEIEYTDESGRPFRVRIVGMLGSSVLQGSLVIAENEFTARFPSVDGYRVFLIDAPAEQADAVSQSLASGLQDYGLTLTSTQERLAAFNAVQNTYLSIFMMLGGLGLVLGSIGLGLVVLRNMLERRGELAMLRAVGFDRSRLQRMVFYEHWGLLVAGLICGVVAAGVAVVPALQSPVGDVPYGWLLLTLAAIAASGALWVWLAGTLALRGRLLDALRNE